MHSWIGWDDARRRVMFQIRALGVRDRTDPKPGAGLSPELSEALRKHILVAVTGGCIINRIVHALEEAGFVVHTVQGSSRALENIHQAEPLLIIVCGAPAGETYRALRTLSSAPILALLPDAGQADGVDVLSALEAGADDCQFASIGEREVLQRVRVLLRRRA